MKNLFGLVLFAMLLAAPAQANNWYTGVYGGMNWNDVINQKFVDDKSGYVIGGVVGKTVPAVAGLRIEADMSFRQNEVDLFGGAISADHDTFALMANVVYDLPVFLGPVQPYVLAGVGYGHTEATFEDVALLKLENSGLAWQLGAGANVKVADGISAGLGYRYLSAPEIEVLGLELSDGGNHSVVAELKFAL